MSFTAQLSRPLVAWAAEGACAAMFLAAIMRPPTLRQANAAAWMGNAIFLDEPQRPIALSKKKL